MTGFAGIFRDFGTMAAVIQRRELPSALLDSVFWLNMGIGLAIAILIALLAPVIAIAMREPQLTAVLWLLALVFPIGSLGLVQQALLERASRFRSVALIECCAAFAGLATGVLAALAGWGVYSLVSQTIVAWTVVTAGLWVASTWRPAWRCSLALIREIAGFSGNLVGFQYLQLLRAPHGHRAHRALSRCDGARLLQPGLPLDAMAAAEHLVGRGARVLSRPEPPAGRQAEAKAGIRPSCRGGVSHHRAFDARTVRPARALCPRAHGRTLAQSRRPPLLARSSLYAAVCRNDGLFALRFHRAHGHHVQVRRVLRRGGGLWHCRGPAVGRGRRRGGLLCHCPYSVLAASGCPVPARWP